MIMIILIIMIMIRRQEEVIEARLKSSAQSKEVCIAKKILKLLFLDELKQLLKIRYWKELILFSGCNKHPRGQVAPEDGQHCLHPGDA